jgi:hypothetical protein
VLLLAHFLPCGVVRVPPLLLCCPKLVRVFRVQASHQVGLCAHGPFAQVSATHAQTAFVRGVYLYIL